MQLKKNISNAILLDRNMTDLIKFLSCLMIALHHYSQDMVVAGSRNPIYHVFSTQGGYLGVAIFFFLSGYGLMKSDMKLHLGFWSFFRKRLRKTYYPAVFVSLIWGVWLLVAGEKFNFQWIIGVIWFNDEVFWFVRTIIWLYIAFYIYVFVGALNHIEFFKVVLKLILAALVLWWTNMDLINGSSVVLFFVGVSLAEQDKWCLKRIRQVYPVVICTCIIVGTVVNC